ncbi:antitoxin [Pseudomonas sp. Pseusp122]|uniref:antitoxin n=1 Tax=unclassified Pseudomonas TaxID=196821 RepID=UPI0039A61B1C
MSQTAKVFLNGRSQAVRLPAAFRFDSDEVFIRRDPVTGDVILSRKPESWDGFLSLLEGEAIPDDFLGEQERDHALAASKDPFEGMDE